MKRRSFLKGSMATGTLTIAASAGLLNPSQVFAAYPTAAYEAADVDGAVMGIMGDASATDSGDIMLKAPVQAENGAVVPVKVSTKDGMAVSKIALVVEGNPKPLVLSAELGDGTNGTLSGRIKMGQTSNIVAYAMTAGGVIKAAQEVKVTVGGCGG